MPLPVAALSAVGIQFIAENADDFLDIFNKVAGNVAIATEQVERFAGVLGPMSGSTKEVEKAIDDATVSFGEFDWVMHTISVTMANLITNGIMKLSSFLAGIPQEAYAAAGALQDMEITLQTLVAGDFLASGATDEMTDALARSVPVVEGLMDKLEELSVASPFRYQQILSVFQMNKSFGMATEMAFETTRAITNLAATMKGVPNITSRLSYNFSQMALIGKITARDMRDLRMAGLDLEKVFQRQLGMTVKEVNKELATGAMVFEDVSKAFVSYVDKYIGPAAMRASRTLSGLKSTLDDIKFFAYGNMFKRLGDEIATGLGTILDAALNILRSETFKEIGVVFAVWAKGISDFAVQMFQPLIDKTEDFDQYMSGKAQAMFDWGLNIAESLANGIIAGMSYLTSAMIAIGNLLANWLMPGSPPKVAPNIDKWGLNTAREWLKGFSNADYSILEGIQRPLKQTLSTLMSMGMLDAGGDQKLFADLSKSIMKALDGELSFESVIKKISAKTGPFGQDMAKLVGLQFDYYKATEAAVKAQEDLIAAQKKEQDATNKVYSSVKEYNDLLRKGADKKTLRAKLEQINANRKEQLAARQNTMAIGEQYVAAQQGIGTIQEQISNQQKLLDTLLELSGAYASAQQAQEAAAAAAAASGGRAAAAGGGTAQTPRIPAVAIPFSTSEMSKKINLFKDRLLKQMDELRDGITERFREVKDNLLAVWTPLAAKIINIWDAVKTIITGGKIEPYQIRDISELFGIKDSDTTAFLDRIQSTYDVVTGIFSGAPIEQGDIMNIAALFGIDAAKVSEIVGIVTSIANTIRTVIAEVPKFILPILSALWTYIVQVVSMATAVFQTLFTQMGTGKESTDGTTLSLEELGTKIAETITKIGDFVTQLIMWMGVFVQFNVTLFSLLGLLAKVVSGILTTLFNVFSAVFYAIETTIKGSIQQFINAIKALWLIIQDIFKTGGKNVGKIVSDWWKSHIQIGSTAANKIKETFSKMWDRIKQTWERVSDKFKSFWDNLVKLVNFVPTVKKHFETNMEGIKKAVGFVGDAFQKLKDFLAGIKWPEIKIPLPDIEGGVRGITNFFEGLGGEDTSIEVDVSTPDFSDFGGYDVGEPPEDTRDTTAIGEYLSTGALENYTASVQDAWTATNGLSSSMLKPGLNAPGFSAAMVSGAIAMDGLATESFETQSALETYSAEQIKYGQNLMSSLDGMIYKYDELQAKMDDWLQNTATDVVNMLGTKFSESSEQYRQALVKVDEIMGTNYTKQLDTKTALQDLIDTYAETGDVEQFGKDLQALKDEEMASMEQGLQDVTEKAGLLYDALLSLPANLQVEIGFDVEALPGWLIEYMKTGDVSGYGGANATFRPTPLKGPGKIDKPEAQASGGAVHKNKPYLVGEEGPEWFIPPNPGKILRTELPLPSRFFDYPTSQSVTNSVTIEFGTVTISNAQEGAVFEQRVERAVRKALGA